MYHLQLVHVSNGRLVAEIPYFFEQPLITRPPPAMVWRGVQYSVLFPPPYIQMIIDCRAPVATRPYISTAREVVLLMSRTPQVIHQMLTSFRSITHACHLLMSSPRRRGRVPNMSIRPYVSIGRLFVRYLRAKLVPGRGLSVPVNNLLMI